VGGEVTVLTLPYPPSANRLWRNIRGKTLKSAVYRAWLIEAGQVLFLQKPASVTGQYRLMVIATRPDQRARDIDNLIKPVSDLLAQCGVVSNDSKAQSVFAGWSMESTVPGGQIIVSVEPVTAPIFAMGKAA